MNPPAAQSYTVLPDGEFAMSRMRELIRGARESVRLEMYIFVDDSTGRLMRGELTEAAARGVRVRVLVDAFGSLELFDSFWTELRRAGGEVAWFNPMSLSRITIRNHRKLLVCDDQVAILGGFNVSDDYAGDGVERGWRDLGLEICGELASALSTAFEESWNRAEMRHRRLLRIRKSTTSKRVDSKNAELLLSGPGRNRGLVRRGLIKDLRRSRDVIIEVAYFLPGWGLRRAIQKAARRGANVRIILAGLSDVALSRDAGRSLYGRLLRSGVRLFEYQPQVLHSKCMVMDDVVYIGSSNLDPRSLQINYELMLRVDDAGLAGEFRRLLEADLAHCVEIDRKTWSGERGWWTKLRERFSYWLVARIDPWFARRQLKNLR